MKEPLNMPPPGPPPPIGGVCLAGNRFVLAVWFALGAAAFLLAVPTVHDTGLDYDEALYGHLARDFLQGKHCPQHMPGSQSVDLWGKPFPVFVQGYLGAVKCWMLLPTFAVFGAGIAVMRFTMLGWGLLGVLFLMLWVRRARGQTEAALAGLLLVADPAFFFPTVCDWGAFVPSFCFRCAGLFFAGLWWQERRVRWMALAGAAFGIGFLNKIDFIVVLLALAVAVLLARPRAIAQSVRAEIRHWAVGAGAFLLAGAPMLINCVRWFRSLLEVQSGAREGEFAAKLHIAGSLLDGSYFYRLMEAGGLFHRMFEAPSRVWTPFGIVLLVALAVLVFQLVSDNRRQASGWPLFLVTGLLVSAAGVLLLPDAIRIHHFLLTYPFPQLIIVAAAVWVWRSPFPRRLQRQVARGLTLVAVLGVLVGHVLALRQTQQFVSATGGRGTWSKALETFAGEIRTRDDLVIASLDWGFHEQLSFLTDGPQLYELTWNIQEGKPVSLLQETNFVYLVHPPEYSLFDYGQTYLQAALQAAPGLVVQSRTNLEGRVVFQYFRFPRR
jgi:hypothetical protein